MDERTIHPPTGEDEFGFDWGRPGERPFVGKNERQARYAFARLSGYNQSESATLAEYRGDAQVIATQGSRCQHSTSVQALMAAATAARGEQLEEACDPQEVLKRLSMAMRAPAVKPAEMAQLSNAFRSLENQVNERKAREMASPTQILDEMARDFGEEFWPLIQRLADLEQIDWEPRKGRLNGNGQIDEMAADQPSAPASPLGNSHARTERPSQ